MYLFHIRSDTQEKEDTLLIKAARLGKVDVINLLLNAGLAIETINKVAGSVNQIQHSPLMYYLV